MSLIIKPSEVRFKSDDDYVGINAVAEKTTDELVADVKTKSASIVSEASKAVEEANSSLNTLKKEKVTFVESITSALEYGPDTTLTLSGVSADAKVVGDKFTEVKEDLNEYKDGFTNLNLWNKAELKYADRYVNFVNGKITYSGTNAYGSWIMPVDGTKKYTFSHAIRFALPLANDKVTATSSALLTNLTTIDMSEYPDTEYFAFSFTYADAPCAISEGDEAKEGYTLPAWSDKFSTVKSFGDLEGKLTGDMVEGYEKGNLFSNCELYAENNYVNITSGHITKSGSDSFNIYILPVESDAKYTFGNYVQFALPLSSDKYTATSSALLPNITQFDASEYDGTEYLAFSFNKVTYPISDFIVSKGESATTKDTHPEWVGVDALQTEVDALQTEVDALQTEVDAIDSDISKGVVSKTGTFSASGNNILLSSARTNLRKGIRLVFEGTVTSGTDFEIGFSISENSATTGQHNVIDVTADNVSYNSVSYPHGLTITGRVQLIFEYLANGTADITLLCNGNRFKQNVDFLMTLVAVPYAMSNGLIATDCKLSFICTDIRKKIWMFGDSYFTYSACGWTYYLKEYGYDVNVLLDGWPGMGGTNARTSFAKLVKMGTPKYAIWFEGMNDGTDSDDSTPNTNWKTEVDNFLIICTENGITPIFATIPNVPSINHNGKNAWIKASGYRYIDMCHAVGADVSTSWYGDMLSSDKVHPSESGAKALFAQVLLDLPEVMLDNL